MLGDAPLHVRLLNLLSAIRDLSPFDVMTADEEELLRTLIVRWHSQDNIAVSDIMRDLAGVSETTAYRRLIALRDKGMVEMRVDAKDRRTKFVDPTDLSDAYVAQINRALSGLISE
jgi:DNA-binding MarR family transcriptional regulator